MKPQVRVLHVITTLDIGGAEASLVNLLAAQMSTRLGAAVVCLTGADALASRVVDMGVAVHSMRLKSYFCLIFRLWRLRAIVRSYRPQIIQGWMYHGNFVASVLGWMARGRVPVVWNIRQSLHAIEKEKLMTRTMIAMGAALSRWQAGIVFNSRVSATQHQRLGYRGLLLRVLPNGFDCERFKPSISAGRTLRAELGVEAGVEIVGMVARYHPVKDHQNFLRAAALLAKRRRNVHFVLAGAAVDAENHVLQKLINCLELKGRVHLLGARSDVEMIAAGLSVATLSSWSEAFPNAIGEAMSCGVPCVVTRVGDAGDLVGDSGVVVPPKDASALADGWERILALSATDRSALGEMARKRISDNYKMQHVAALYESFYDDVLGGKE